jgi:small redox-active disulfide protein 2
MPRDDVIQIKINKHLVGIIGLKTTMEAMATEFGEKRDHKIQAELLKRLCKDNYIPDGVRAEYGKSFLREFKKFLGKPYEDETPEGLEIKVLGPGCAQCDGLETLVIEVLAEMDLAADVEHVTDIKEIGEYGVMGVPALIINGSVKSVGRMPHRNKILEWLKEAQK